MKFKKILAVLLAVLITASFCVPAAAAATYEEYCSCEDPWLENPREIDGGFFRAATNAHIFAIHTMYDCSHCGLEYIEENTDFYAEPHYEGEYSHKENGIHYFYCGLAECGVLFAAD